MHPARQAFAIMDEDLLVTDGKLLAEYDLPACPVFDGMSAADGKLLVPMVSGEVACRCQSQRPDRWTRPLNY
jgi:hypothetical protein